MLTPPDKWPYQLLYYIANCKLTKNNNRIEERHANFKWYINRKLHVPVIDIGINDDKLGRRFFYVAYYYCQKRSGLKTAIQNNIWKLQNHTGNILKESALILPKTGWTPPAPFAYKKLGLIPSGYSEIPHWVIRDTHVLKWHGILHNRRRNKHFI